MKKNIFKNISFILVFALVILNLLGSFAVSTVKAETTDSILSIRLAKNLPLGSYVTVKGIVTSKENVFIQDNTGGINISHQINYERFSVGDLIKVSGTLVEINGLSKIINYSSEVVLNRNEVPKITPNQITIDEISEEYEGMLISLDNLELNKLSYLGKSIFKDDSGNEIESNEVQVLDGILEGDIVDVVAIVIQYNDDYQLYIRNSLDVVKNSEKNILIDDAHGNVDVPNNTLNFMNLLKRYGYKVKLNNEEITASTLENISVLVINTPNNEENNFTENEELIISHWIKNGGSAIITSKSNRNFDSTLLNSLMSEIGSTIRFNDDSIYEPVNSDKYIDGRVWSINSYNTPKTNSDLNKNIEAITISNGCSLVDRYDNYLLNNPYRGLEMLLGGNKTSYNANSGENGYVYNESGDSHGERIPIIAKENINKGKIIVAGNQFYSNYHITKDTNNKVLTLRILDYLSGHKRINSIKKAKEEFEEGEIVTVKGIVTAPSNIFNNQVYIQDKTSGISIYGIAENELTLGIEIVATGELRDFNGEMQLVFNDFDYDILYVGKVDEVKPTQLTTLKSMSPKYLGILINTEGTIIDYDIENGYIKINDGSGKAYIDINTEIDINNISQGDKVSVTGISSISSDRTMIKLRFNDDLVILEEGDENYNDNEKEYNKYPHIKNIRDKTKEGEYITIRGDVIGVFDDAIYIQDHTSGITLITDEEKFSVGDKLEVKGYTKYYKGDLVIEVDKMNYIGKSKKIKYKKISAKKVSWSKHLGELINTKGIITKYNEDDKYIIINDGKSEAYIYLNDYTDDFEINNLIEVNGIVTIIDGNRVIRIRNKNDIKNIEHKNSIKHIYKKLNKHKG